jgi:HD-like signal output (HDOD) protein
MPVTTLSPSSRMTDFFEGVQLPTMPDVARELIATMHDEDTPFERVRHAIARDPALTAKLIRLANSARFGLRRQVASLDDAITLVGLNQVRTLAMAACLGSSFTAVRGVDSAAFWQESMAIAGYAQWLARTLGADAQQAWLVGFMVRLGELVIAQKMPDRIEEIERLPHFAGGRWEREQSVLGFTEGAVTAALARRWNFPEAIAHALETASDPVQADPFCRMGGILHIATLLAELALDEHKSHQDAVGALPRDVVDALQLDPAWLVAHMPDVAGFVDTPVHA